MSQPSSPSFDYVPAAAAPDKRLSAAFLARELAVLPTGSRHVDDIANARSVASVSIYGRESTIDASFADDNMTAIHSASAYVNGHADQELPALQVPDFIDEDGTRHLQPIHEDDPTSYDLIRPSQKQELGRDAYSLENQTQALFSKDHLQVIFADPGFLLKFTSFLGVHRPQSVPILVHYLDSLKALRAIHYSNAILEGLDPVEGLSFTSTGVETTVNTALVARTNEAFEYLVREELPAFVTYQYIQIVTASISARVSGSLPSHLREASEGLAEVFCLTDPNRPDNPIVFASEEFNRTTQYGMSYILGRNCRFLQGPCTNPLSVARLRNATKAGRAHQEVFLNYRRDGSPFVNLLMIAPLCDSRGVVRYNIGAQVDVSGLVKDCADMESLQRLLDYQSRNEPVPDHQQPDLDKSDELRELSEMLNQGEISTIRRFGGRMHRETRDDGDEESVTGGQPRLLIKDPSAVTPPVEMSSTLHTPSGKLNGVYQHYLLVRPYPSLRILFASPSQRIPGILQSPFMNRIGGSNRVREELTTALAEGRGVTAKVRWVNRPDDEGRNKWIHCTPLLGINSQIGVWMVVIVDDDRHRRNYFSAAGGRTAPPVPAPSHSVGGSGGATTPDRNGRHAPHKTNGQPVARRMGAGYAIPPGHGYVNEPRSGRESLDGPGEGSVDSFHIG